MNPHHLLLNSYPKRDLEHTKIIDHSIKKKLVLIRPLHLESNLVQVP